MEGASRKTHRRLFYAVIAFSLFIIWLSVPIFKGTIEGKPLAEPPWMPGIILSLFPLAAFTIVFILLKGQKYKQFNLLFGILLATLAYEFLADPWSVEWRLRMMPEAGMGPILIYLMIGTAFVLLATFFFKRGIEPGGE